MITVANVRSQISDRPQPYPPSSTSPEIIGLADGAQTIFALSFENYVPGSLVVYVALPSVNGEEVTYAAQPASAYTVGTQVPTASTSATNQIVTFGTAPIAGSVVAARYQATAFSDDDLAGYLRRVQLTWSDDRMVLKAVQFDLIDVILSDQRRLEILAQGDYRRDATAFARNLLTLKESLRKDLAGGPLPGATVPAIGVGWAGARVYTPLR